MNKRLLKEITNLIIQQRQKPLIENDYVIHFDDTNVNVVHAIIRAPFDSVYKHKFVRLDMKIPDNYPYSPPEVFFVNHDGVRIHPNMYENGKCCSTILNTWGDSKYEKWTSSMGIETILLTFHSFLDNNPYTYEPGGRDDTSYTTYVLHQSWYTCLMRYLQYETIPLFTEFMQNYMFTYIDDIFMTLDTLNERYPRGTYSSRCFEIDDFHVNYEQIKVNLQYMYNYFDYCDTVQEDDSAIEFTEFLNKDYACSICFDTEEENSSTITLSCHHKFHKHCLMSHIETNHPLCSVCRREVSEKELDDAHTNPNTDTNTNTDKNTWIVNPTTKRRVKKGSRTHMRLVQEGIIQDEPDNL